MRRLTQAWSKQGYIGVKIEGGITAYFHDGYVNYHFTASGGHGREIQRQQAEAWAAEIGGTLVEYEKENVFVVHDERGVGRTKTGREVPGKAKATTKKIIDSL